MQESTERFSLCYDVETPPLAVMKHCIYYVRETVLDLSRRLGFRTRKVFQGAAMDTGAQKPVIGLEQAEAYCRELGLDLNLAPTNSTFVFGDHACRSLGRLNIIIPTPTSNIAISTHVVGAGIAFLIGLETLDRCKWNVLTTENRLHSVVENWYMPLVRKLGHILLPWVNKFKVYYSRQQLLNMHLHFMHPSTSKLMNLLERAYPDRIKPDTKQFLEDISKSCHACQVFAPRPLTFSVRFPAGIIFNKRVLLDLMYIDRRPVLHIVDVGTNFAAARFLTAEDAQTVWNTFLYAWVTMYLGYPEHMLTDQGSIFRSKEWETRCSEAQVSLEATGT